MKHNYIRKEITPMSYYTTIGKTVSCPYLDMKVTLTGKYRFIGESCQFSYATCEIVEKSKLPPYEQLEDTKYYVCPPPKWEL